MALALNACQESVLEPTYDNVMRFSFAGQRAQTKISGGEFEAQDHIGVYVTDYVTETLPMPLQVSGNRANNACVTFDGASWTPDKMIYWGKGKADVYAYYPFCEDVNDVNQFYFELATDQSGAGYESSDFLWAKAEGVSQSDGVVDLAMNHLMSKLTVKIVAGEDYIGSLPEDVSVLVHSLVSNARIDLEAGNVVKDPYSSAESIKMRNLGIKTYDGVKAVVLEAVVVPQMLEGILPFLEINSKSVSYLIEDEFVFHPGTAYTYTVTLNTSTNAIKVEIGCEIEDWNNPGSEGSDDEDDDDSGEGEDTDITSYVDLSSAGTANCYLVRQSGDYRFKAVIGNTDGTVGNVKSVEVLWESFGTEEMPEVGDLISSVSYKNGYVCFSTPDNFRNGNALIAAKNSKGVILWSWHIWCAEEGWKEQVYYNDAGTMMDRNLGATSATPGNVGALGLMYQWGRKDPFLGSGAIPATEYGTCSPAASTGVWYVGNRVDNGMVDQEEANPTTYYGSRFDDMSLWASEKTVYDPCPAGWRIPDGGPDGVWNKACQGRYTQSEYADYDNHGWDFIGYFGDEHIWYPFTGELNSLLYIDYTFAATYASCTRSSSYKDRTYGLDLGSWKGNIYTTYDQVGMTTCSIRCQKDE